MTPQHLLPLCAIICYVWSIEALIIKPYRPFRHENKAAPEFWWDLTLDRDAGISNMLLSPLTSQQIDAQLDGNAESRKLDWEVQWAYGTSMQWLAGGHAFWTAWVWNSTANSENVTGGGFIYNETDLGIVAGVNWLQSGHNGVITWNCFVEGNVAGELPWDPWQMTLDDDSTIGFKKSNSKWGFMRGDNRVLSKHCATGSPVVGKRYKYYYGKEIESSVQNDPFQQETRKKRSPNFFEKVSQTVKEWFQKVKNFFTGGDQEDGPNPEASERQEIEPSVQNDPSQQTTRRKRSPDFFEKVSQTVKEWFQKVKKFFTGGDQQDGTNPEGRDGDKKCNTFIDLMVRVIDLILGRKRQGSTPRDQPDIPQNPGGVPQGPNGEIPNPGEGGDPPGGADVPPTDVEEIDPAQNDAIRDWE